MGRTHALSGAAIFTAAAAALPLSLPTGQVMLGAVVCAGAAVLPDIDHHGSHVARTFGPFTRGFAWVVGKVAGGHRNGTHSALGVALIAALVFLASGVHTRDRTTLWIGCGIAGAMLTTGLLFGLLDSGRGRGKAAYRERWHGFVSVVVCALVASAVAVGCYQYGRQAGTVLVGAILILVLAAAIRPLRIKGVWDDLAPIPIALAMLWLDADLTVLPYAIVAGVVIHIAGDMITFGGCPLGWPWSQTMRGLKWFRTGSRIENRLVAPVLAVVLVAATSAQVYPIVLERVDPPAAGAVR
ncbi:MAG: metal-dependent hydrolase [Streptosporangiaceae bacterium]